VKAIENSHLAEVTRLLGAPFIKKAGIYLNKTVGEKVEKGEVLLTFYTVSSMRLNLAKEAIKRLPIYTIN
jgi:thymidine phosphorylase